MDPAGLLSHRDGPGSVGGLDPDQSGREPDSPIHASCGVGGRIVVWRQAGACPSGAPLPPPARSVPVGRGPQLEVRVNRSRTTGVGSSWVMSAIQLVSTPVPVSSSWKTTWSSLAT